MTLALVAGFSVSSEASRGASPAAPESPRSASQASYFAILGEVACPGVYELPADCTLGQLVRYAGGITRDADGNARVFRASRFAERLFVALSEPAILYPGDLIVIDRRATVQAASRSATKSEVQIGVLNLIERPVVLTMPGDQASLRRIVEFLRQPPQWTEQIRIIGPSRKSVDRTDELERDAELLRSGTVLIFPKRSVRLASLPALPAPITPTQSPPVDAAKSQAHEEATHDSGVDVAPGASRNTIGRTAPNLPATGGTPSQESIERLVHASRTARSSSRISGSPFRNVASQDWEFERLREEENSHARSNVFFFVLAGTAALVMMLTIGSMGSRWINEVRSRDGDRPSTILPAPPTLSSLAGANRPIRVDANQPQTRLGIDLAVFERVKALHAKGTRSDPTPKAA